MISVTIYKLISLLVGLGFAYMGYRLFMANIWGHAGDFTAQYENIKVVIKRAAPGTFFAVAGTVIVVATILRGFEVELVSSKNPTAVQFDAPPPLPITSPLTKE